MRYPGLMLMTAVACKAPASGGEAHGSAAAPPATAPPPAAASATRVEPDPNRRDLRTWGAAASVSLPAGVTLRRGGLEDAPHPELWKDSNARTEYIVHIMADTRACTVDALTARAHTEQGGDATMERAEPMTGGAIAIYALDNPRDSPFNVIACADGFSCTSGAETRAALDEPIAICRSLRAAP